MRQYQVIIYASTNDHIDCEILKNIIDLAIYKYSKELKSDFESNQIPEIHDIFVKKIER